MEDNKPRSIPPDKIADNFAIEGNITVSGDKVVVINSPRSEPPVSTDRIRMFSIMGTIFGSVLGIIATLFGLILIATSDTDQIRACWKKFTAFTMLGWIVFSVLWFGGIGNTIVDGLQHKKNMPATDASATIDVITVEPVATATAPTYEAVEAIPLTLPSDAGMVPFRVAPAVPAVPAVSAIPVPPALPIHPWVAPKKVIPASTATATVPAKPVHKIYQHQFGYCRITDECDGVLICVKNSCQIAK